MESASQVMKSLEGEKPTFESIRKDVMRRARAAELDEQQAESLLRRELRKAGITVPDTMAKEQEFKKGGMPKKKKVQMMRGGMANGKQHMYAAGGMVSDGLKALKASGPKGLEAYNKITGK